MVDEARALSGGTVTEQVAREVETTLDTALSDPGAGDAVRTGRLLRALSGGGFEAVDLGGAVAVPDAAPAPRRRSTSGRPAAQDADTSTAARPTRTKQPKQPTAAERAAEKRAKAKASRELAAARREAEQLGRELADRDAELDEARERVEAARSRLDDAGGRAQGRAHRADERGEGTREGTARPQRRGPQAPRRREAGRQAGPLTTLPRALAGQPSATAQAAGKSRVPCQPLFPARSRVSRPKPRGSGEKSTSAG